MIVAPVRWRLLWSFGAVGPGHLLPQGRYTLIGKLESSLFAFRFTTDEIDFETMVMQEKMFGEVIEFGADLIELTLTNVYARRGWLM